MKIENVDGSIIKSKIFDIKMNDPTKSFFFQSSDIIKQYIQEIGTSNLFNVC